MSKDNAGYASQHYLFLFVEKIAITSYFGLLLSTIYLMIETSQFVKGDVFVSYQDVLDFWFNELTPSQWFTKDDEMDQTIKARFSQLHQQASQGECDEWRRSLKGRLAEIIVLDQFSRNLYRDSSLAFSSDSMALVLAQEALAHGGDLSELSAVERSFIYMPFMHSESLKMHDKAVVYFSEPGLENNLEFEHRHRDIILRFGRYPHRNQVLGRNSTPEEIAFLKEPGSSF